jgi:hypothetical protein
VQLRQVRAYSLFGVIALAFGIQPTSAFAQDRWPLTFELYVGATRGFTDNDEGYRGSRSGPLLELLAGTRLHSAERAGVFISLVASVYAVNAIQTADCLVAPDGGCVPWYPGFGVVSLLGGLESRSATLRLQGGPAFVSWDRDGTAGVSARFDAALPLLGHLSAVASLSTLFVLSYNDDRFYNIGFGVGLRLR